MVLAGAGRGAVGSVKARRAADRAVVALRTIERERRVSRGGCKSANVGANMFLGDIAVISTKPKYRENKCYW